MKKKIFTLVAVAIVSTLVACSGKAEVKSGMKDNMKESTTMAESKMDTNMNQDKMESVEVGKDNMGNEVKPEGMEIKKDDMKSDNMKDDMKMQDDMKHDDMKMEDNMKSDDMKDDMKKDDMKHDNMKMEDNMKSDDMKDDMKMQDDMKHDNMKSDKTSSDDMKTNDMKADNMKAVNSKSENTKSLDFSLKDLDGNTVSLSSYKGKKVYMKYWASWCSICLAGLEDLNTLAGQDNGYEIITLVSPNVRGEKDAESFKKWFNSLGYKNIKVLFDEDGKVAKELGVVAYPTSIYVDSDSKVSEVRVGHNENKVINETMKNNVL
jgi:thioredoxin family protein